MAINQAMFEALQPGVTELNKARSDAQLEQLKSYLQGSQQMKNQQAGIKMLSDLKRDNPDLVKNGTSLAIDPTTGSIHSGADPYARQAQKQTDGDNAARHYANQVYNQGVSKIEPMLTAAKEGLDAANDPKNPMSAGMFLGAVTRAYGLSRFPNAEEAKQLLPPTVHATYAKLLSSIDNPQNPLSDSQRDAANTLFKGVLDDAAAKHSRLKQNAVNAYRTSTYANPQGIDALSNTVGKPLEDYIADTTSKYKNLTQTPGPNLNATPPAKSLLGKIADAWNSRNTPAAAAPAQPTMSPQYTAPAGPQAPGATGPHGPSVIQDGKTYKWNPNLNKYE